MKKPNIVIVIGKDSVTAKVYGGVACEDFMKDFKRRMAELGVDLNGVASSPRVPEIPIPEGPIPQKETS